MARRTVLVVGGGAAGVITAAQVLRAAAEPVEVRLVERAEVAGPGLAYAPGHPSMLLNNHVARMSAVEDDPGHLMRWCHAQGLLVGPHAFLARDTYGRYLQAVLADAATEAAGSGSSLARVRGEVVGLADLRTSYVATLGSGAQLVADDVVLALGNPPPRDLPSLRRPARRWEADPWDAGLVRRVRPGDRVLLAGTGLTTVDVAIRLLRVHRDVEVVAASRRGVLPLAHETRPPAPVLPFPVSGSLGGLLADVRRRRSADPDRWRELVESLKLSANAQWQAWGRADQRTFLDHVARRWEVARHRMSPAAADAVESLRLEGRLHVHRTSQVHPADFDVVVNCTGPAPACTPGWSTLVDSMAARGLLRPGPHGLGLDVTAHGALVDRQGRPARSVHVVGAARRGVEWEVAAVPDLRRQAAVVADRLTRRATSGSLVG